MMVGPFDTTLGSAGSVDPSWPLALRSSDATDGRSPDVITLGYLHNGFQEIARLDGRYISTEVAGGFTGRVVPRSAI